MVEELRDVQLALRVTVKLKSKPRALKTKAHWEGDSVDNLGFQHFLGGLRFLGQCKWALLPEEKPRSAIYREPGCSASPAWGGPCLGQHRLRRSCHQAASERG